jgi:hypothetical protein
MKGKNNNIDEILERYLPRASDDEVQSALCIGNALINKCVSFWTRMCQSTSWQYCVASCHPRPFWGDKIQWPDMRFSSTVTSVAFSCFVVVDSRRMDRFIASF